MNPSPMKRLFGSRKFWISLSTGIVSVAAQMLPLIAMIQGWDATKQQAFSAACNGVSMVVGGLGAVLVIMIGTEDAAEKVTMPPPGQTNTIINNPPPGERR